MAHFANRRNSSRTAGCSQPRLEFTAPITYKGHSSPPSAWVQIGQFRLSNIRDDAQASLYDGSNKSVMHFDKGQMPPADAFWSLTMYDGEYTRGQPAQPLHT